MSYSNKQKIQVLLVDNSPFMRVLVSDLLKEDREIEVTATAKNGKEALVMIKEKRPDVVIMDIDMPIMDGLTALKTIMNSNPLPVIMLSSLTKEGNKTTLQALELGAFDFITKPTRGPFEIKTKQQEIIEKVKVAARSSIYRIKTTGEEPPSRPVSAPAQNKLSRNGFPVVAIASSSGGPKALKKIIPRFPGDFPAAFIIVQHMPEGFTASLAARLNQESGLFVKEASGEDQVIPGQVLIAPGGQHLEISLQGKVTLNSKPPLWGVRPAADYMLKSTARAFHDRVIGVVLTGMGRDGTEGLKAVKEQGGICICEDESTCIVYGMPKSAVEAGVCDYQVPLHRIPQKIKEIIEGGRI